VNNREILQSGQLAGAQARGGPNAPHRILVVDDNRGIREFSTEVLIRHKTNFLAKNISMKRQQNQARNAAVDSLPVRL
jgi:hypothetical protein